MRANAVGKGCSLVERAYCAGFLDADGAIMACIEPHQGKRHGFRVRIVVKVTQQRRAVLDWMRGKWKVGAVRANRPGTPNQAFDLLVRNQRDARQVLALLLPFLREKKRQAKLALRILDLAPESKADMIRQARLADALSRFNVRSKNRRKNLAAKVEEQLSPND